MQDSSSHKTVTTESVLGVLVEALAVDTVSVIVVTSGVSHGTVTVNVIVAVFPDTVIGLGEVTVVIGSSL